MLKVNKTNLILVLFGGMFSETSFPSTAVTGTYIYTKCNVDFVLHNILCRCPSRWKILKSFVQIKLM